MLQICLSVIQLEKLLRQSSPRRSVAVVLARSLAAIPGIVIVSRLAAGIDTQAHLGALSASGKTLAVFGTELAQVYPPENRELAEQIVQSGGLVVSCYEKPARDQTERERHFVERDRVQAALSLGVIPIQASLSSGTRHAKALTTETEPKPHAWAKLMHRRSVGSSLSPSADDGFPITKVTWGRLLSQIRQSK